MIAGGRSWSVSWTFEHRPELGVLWVTTEGVHTSEDVRRTAMSGFAVAKGHGVTRILVDDRKMTPDFRALDVSKLPRSFEGWGAPPGARGATVYRAIRRGRRMGGFSRRGAAISARMGVRVFADSVAAALEWLKGSGADKA